MRETRFFKQLQRGHFCDFIQYIFFSVEKKLDKSNIFFVILPFCFILMSTHFVNCFYRAGCYTKIILRVSAFCAMARTAACRERKGLA